VFGKVLYIYKTLAAHGVGPNTPDPLKFRSESWDVELTLMGEGVGMDLHWDPPEATRPVCKLQHRHEQKASVRSA